MFLILSLISTIFWQITFLNHPTDHAVYLSVVDIGQADKLDEAAIKIRVFVNDIEDAVFNELGQRIDLSNATAFGSKKNVLEKYFLNHFAIVLNGKELQLSLRDSELMGDAVWLLFHTGCDSEWGSISVRADYLMELFPTQSNVVSVVYKGKKHFTRLTQSKTYETIKF